jgi:hypothetical protein
MNEATTASIGQPGRPLHRMPQAAGLCGVGLVPHVAAGLTFLFVLIRRVVRLEPVTL